MSMPLRSGRLTSSSSRSNGRSSRRESPTWADSALETWYPSDFSRSSRPSRISDSSSTTRIDPLDMDRFPDSRELDVEGSAPAWRRADINSTGVFFDDPVAHRQAETCAAPCRFGREKRIKNLMDVFTGNAVARVNNLYLDAAIVRGSAHFQHSACRHGIARIQEQVQENLLQLIGGAAHRRKAIGELLDDANLRGLQGMRDQRQRFFHNAIQVHIGKLAGARSREIQQVIDNFAGAEGLLDDFFDDGVARITVGHLLGEHLDVVGDDRQRGVNFVRDSRGQQPQGGELFRLAHLLFHAFALRDVVEEKQPTNALTRFADQRRDRNIQNDQTTLALQAVLVNTSDLLLIVAGGNFRSEFRRQEAAEGLAYRRVTRHAEDLFHAAIPGFHRAFKVHGEHADVQ